MKVLFIGQSPSQRGVGGTPLQSKAGNIRLAAVAGVTPEVWLERAEAVNVFETWQGKTKKGDAFPLGKATELARGIPTEGRRVVYLGRNVARAFGHRKIEWFEPLKDVRAKAAWCIPHPSGTNRWWNTAVHRETARGFLRALLSV